MEALLAFPAFITYSLPGRIAPRAAAARDLKGTALPLPRLALRDDAFALWLGVGLGEFEAWRAGWRGSEEARRWAGSGEDEAAAADEA